MIRSKRSSTKAKKAKDEDWLGRNENIITYATFFFAALYIICMFVYPWIKDFSWRHVQDVWMSWQSINVGVLAYISTFFIYKATKHSESVKRKRSFKAEKAFLPNALSELDNYFRECAIYLKDCLRAIKQRGRLEPRPIVVEVLPTFPAEHKAVFKQCILTAEDEVANYLSGILMRLQIFRSRMNEVNRFFTTQGGTTQNSTTIMRRISDLAEIHNMSSTLYDFAREVGEFKKAILSEDNIEKSCALLEVFLFDEELEMFRRISNERMNEGGMMRQLREKAAGNEALDMCP